MQMTELAHKDVKSSTINILFVFKTIKENKHDERHGRYIKAQIVFLEIKNTIY